jgi:hypothetical protein
MGPIVPSPFQDQSRPRCRHARIIHGITMALTTGTPISNDDVSPDGQRFLMLEAIEQAGAAPTQIHVMPNWFEELRWHVPPVLPALRR